MQRASARTHPDAILRPDELSEFFLERLGLRAEEEATGDHDSVYRLADLIFDFRKGSKVIEASDQDGYQ